VAASSTGLRQGVPAGQPAGRVADRVEVGEVPDQAGPHDPCRRAEPQATAERRIELEREAAKATRQTPAYTDMTVSWSKSVSLLEALIRANARQARVNDDAPRVE